MKPSRRKKAKREIRRKGNKSNYAKKFEYLRTHGGWGFNYSEPKPWK